MSDEWQTAMSVAHSNMDQDSMQPYLQISILFSVDSFGLEIDDLSNLESMLSLPYGSAAGHFEGTDCSVSSSVLL
jgi:hypothetical protein